MEPYLSPRIFFPEGALPADGVQLRRKKKEILLLFELEDNTTIQLGGKDFDKNAVYEFFDTIEGELDFHVHLETFPDLAAFLEKHTVSDELGKDAEKAITLGSTFSNWLHPYLNFSYQKSILNAYHAQRNMPMGTYSHSLGQLKKNLGVVYLEEANISVEKHVMSDLDRMLNQYRLSSIRATNEIGKELVRDWHRNKVHVITRVLNAPVVTRHFRSVVIGFSNHLIDLSHGNFKRYNSDVLKTVMGLNEKTLAPNRDPERREWIRYIKEVLSRRNVALARNVILGIFAFFFFLWTGTSRGCHRKTYDPNAPKIAVLDHRYEANENTLHIAFNIKIVVRNGRDNPVKTYFSELKPFFPDVDSFLIVATSDERLGKSYVTKHKVVRVDSTYSVKAHPEFEQFLTKEITLECDFGPEKKMKGNYSYLQKIEGKNFAYKSINIFYELRKSKNGYYVNILDQSGIVIDSIAEYYPYLSITKYSDSKIKSGIVHFLNDYFFLDGKEVRKEKEYFTHPSPPDSYFFSKATTKIELTAVPKPGEENIFEIQARSGKAISYATFLKKDYHCFYFSSVQRNSRNPQIVRNNLKLVPVDQKHDLK